MPKVVVNGVTCHYQQLGQGQDVVLVHGLFSNLAFWYLSVMPALAEKFRVTAYDLRGHGYSDMPLKGYTSADLANDLDELLERIGVEQAHVVGHSYGGAVALNLACIHPTRVQSLVLADAWAPSLQPPLPPRTSKRWEATRRQLKQAGINLPDDVPLIVYNYFEEIAGLSQPSGSLKPEVWKPALSAGQWDGGARNARLWLQLVRTTSAVNDIHAEAGLTPQHLRQILQPVLAIFGQYSRCMPTLRGVRAALPRCQAVIVPGMGHFHPLQRQQNFVHQVKQFIDSQFYGMAA